MYTDPFCTSGTHKVHKRGRKKNHFAGYTYLVHLVTLMKFLNYKYSLILENLYKISLLPGFIQLWSIWRINTYHSQKSNPSLHFAKPCMKLISFHRTQFSSYLMKNSCYPIYDNITLWMESTLSSRTKLI